MGKRLNIFFTLLFMIYFCIYAISPLSHSYDPRSDDSQASIFRPKIFIIEFLLSKINNQGADDDSTSSVNILIKKKRATLSSNKPQTSENRTKLAKKVFVSPDNFISAEALYVTAGVKGRDIRSFADSNPCYFGLSPPLA